ncbi:liver-enriched gene 1, tandem duplicate 1 [Sardina pilchardus]|uniref:liver-enriched gene 1, tandem duplicate 1 n=1 Tax=Sardina pilchardus TaxID=27697 RepID=UPI002E151381
MQEVNVRRVTGYKNSLPALSRHLCSAPSLSMRIQRTGLVAALALLASVAQAAVVTENGYPIMWDKAPAELKDMPTAEDGAVTINPWEYLQRMGMYRLMINHTNQYMGCMGPGPNNSPLWGLPLQLGWKLKSGRLVDPTGATTCGQESGDPMCISPKSWWACVNYYLSVIPFLAAVQAGLIGDGVIKITVQGPPEAAEDYCTTFTDCSAKYPDLMSKWETFFTTVKAASESEATDSEKMNQILGAMWAAQQASLQQATTSCAERQKSYSKPEISFAVSWVGSADYVSAAYFLSNLEKSTRFMAPLPGRVLTDADKPPNVPDLSAEENHTLYIFSWMNSINRLLGNTLVNMWNKAMCSDAAREKGRALLDDLVLNPKFAVSGLLSILTGMATNC